MNAVGRKGGSSDPTENVLASERMTTSSILPETEAASLHSVSDLKRVFRQMEEVKP